jgi:hypothetical protein
MTSTGLPSTNMAQVQDAYVQKQIEREQAVTQSK